MISSVTSSMQIDDDGPFNNNALIEMVSAFYSGE